MGGNNFAFSVNLDKMPVCESSNAIDAESWVTELHRCNSVCYIWCPHHYVKIKNQNSRTTGSVSRGKNLYRMMEQKFTALNKFIELEEKTCPGCIT